jgi:hypothetical protein
VIGDLQLLSREQEACKRVQTQRTSVAKSERATIAGTAPMGVLQRKCACGGTLGPSGECEQCRKKRLQRKATSEAPSAVPPIVHGVLRSSGEPLDSETRAFFEPRFGHDFSHVRVHANETAAASARAVSANAYTVGRDVVFDAGKYHPQDQTGRELIAHELAHVVQQQRATTRTGSAGLVIDNNPTAEREADHAAQQATSGRGPIDIAVSSEGRVARQPAPAKDAVEEDILNQLATLHLGSALAPVRADDPIWKKLDPLWMVGLLKLLERANELGYLHVLDNAVDSSVGIFRERLRLAIDAVKMKASRGPVSSVDEAFLKRLLILPGQQQSEIVAYLSGGAKIVGITSPPRPGQPSIADWKTPPRSTQAAATGGLSVASMSTADKIGKTVEFAAAELGPELGKRLKELLTAESIATMAAFLTVYVVSQATPAGWVADVIGGGLLLVSVLMIGTEIIDVVEHLVAFSDLAINAKSEQDLREAGKHLATAITKVGVDVVVAILFKKAGKAAAKPYMRPPPPAELSTFEITTKGSAPSSAERFPANDNAFPFNENLRGSNVIDLTTRRPGATRSSATTQGSAALQLSPELVPEPTQAAPKPKPSVVNLPAPDPKMSSTTAAGAAAAARQAGQKAKEKERDPCQGDWQVRPSGGKYTRYHNDFAAAMVARFRLPADPEKDYSVSKGGKESTDYDSYDWRGQDLYEFKTRHQYLPYEELSITWIRSSGMAAQAADQNNTRISCGIKGQLIWIFDREEVANAARPLLRQCGVDIVQPESWSPNG